jgi:hypothetical protein
MALQRSKVVIVSSFLWVFMSCTPPQIRGQSVNIAHFPIGEGYLRFFQAKISSGSMPALLAGRPKAAIA